MTRARRRRQDDRTRARPWRGRHASSASHQAPACNSTTGAPISSACLDRLGIGLDEHGDPNARGIQLGHVGREVIVALHDVQPAFSRALFALFGHQADSVGSDTQGNAHHLAA